MELKHVSFDTRQSCYSNGWLGAEIPHKLDVRLERTSLITRIAIKYINWSGNVMNIHCW